MHNFKKQDNKSKYYYFCILVIPAAIWKNNVSLQFFIKSCSKIAETK